MYISSSILLNVKNESCHRVLWLSFWDLCSEFINGFYASCSGLGFWVMRCLFLARMGGGPGFCVWFCGMPLFFILFWGGLVYSVLFCLFRLIYTLNLLGWSVFLGFFPGLRGINLDCDFRLVSNLCFIACGCNFSCDYL